MIEQVARILSKRWEMIGFFGIAVSISTLLTWLAVSNDFKRVEEALADKAHRYELEVTQRFAIADAILQSLGGTLPHEGEHAAYDVSARSEALLQSYPFIAGLAWVDVTPDPKDSAEPTLELRSINPNVPHRAVLTDNDGLPHPKLREAVIQSVDDRTIVGSDMVIRPDGGLSFLIAIPVFSESEDSRTGKQVEQIEGAVALYLDAEQFFHYAGTEFDELSVWLLDLDAGAGEARPLFLKEHPSASMLFAPFKVALNIETAERAFWISGLVRPTIADLRLWRIAVAIAGPMALALLLCIFLNAQRRARWRVTDYASKLNRLEQRFKDFADASVDWYWEMDADLRFSYFSNRFTPVTGVPDAMLLGKTRQETGIPNIDQTTWDKHLSDLAAHRSFRDFTHPREKEDGSTVWLAINGKPIFDAQGIFLGYRGNGNDITAKLHREEELAASKVATEAAEAASLQKSEFLANMSHELRTPLNAILGFSQLLAGDGEKLSSADRQEFSNHIHASGQHLLKAINDLLKLAKIESGKEKLGEKIVDIGDVLSTMQTMFTSECAENGIAFNVVAHNAKSSILADPQKLSQLLAYLLSNAFKFTKPGGSVELDCRYDAAGACIFRVTDTGIGIAPEDIPLAFAKFGQIDSSFSREYDGVGLGLPLAQLLAG